MDCPFCIKKQSRTYTSPALFVKKFQFHMEAARAHNVRPKDIVSNPAFLQSPPNLYKSGFMLFAAFSFFQFHNNDCYPCCKDNSSEYTSLNSEVPAGQKL